MTYPVRLSDVLHILFSVLTLSLKLLAPGTMSSALRVAALALRVAALALRFWP